MTPERKAEIRRFAENGYGIPMRMLDELLAALAEAEQERDDLAECVVAFCARVDGHVDASQQRHPTWRGVTTS